LQITEKLSIYKLPEQPDKYGIKNLKRFDSIDLEEPPEDFCTGISPLYSQGEGDKLDKNEEHVIQTRLIFCHGSKKKNDNY